MLRRTNSSTRTETLCVNLDLVQKILVVYRLVHATVARTMMPGAGTWLGVSLETAFGFSLACCWLCHHHYRHQYPWAMVVPCWPAGLVHVHPDMSYGQDQQSCELQRADHRYSIDRVATVVPSTRLLSSALDSSRPCVAMQRPERGHPLRRTFQWEDGYFCFRPTVWRPQERSCFRSVRVLHPWAW